MIDKDSFASLGYATFKSEVMESTLAIATRLGDVYEESSIPIVQSLTPKEKGDVKNTYSAIFGMDIFPMHTDLAHWSLPPRYLLLRYLSPSQEVSTNILDSKLVLAGESASFISRSHFKPRKPINTTINILKISSNGIFRWDSVFIVPANKRAEELQSRILAKIKKSSYQKLFFDTAGDCLLIDNWRMMHGRGQVAHCAKDRRIERIYLNKLHHE